MQGEKVQVRFQSRLTDLRTPLMEVSYIILTLNGEGLNKVVYLHFSAEVEGPSVFELALLKGR